MATLEQFFLQLIPAFYQGNSNELISFGIFFVAMWLIAVVIDATIKKNSARGLSNGYVKSVDRNI